MKTYASGQEKTIKSNRQIQVGEYRWLFVPTTTKDKYKILRIVASAMRIDLQVTLL